jgi:hypothetical protein
VLRRCVAAAVRLSSRNRPAATAAGFAKGDQIAALDGKPAAVYPDLAIITLRFADSGSHFTFTMKDGSPAKSAFASRSALSRRVHYFRGDNISSSRAGADASRSRCG